jgi:hypothetical protein
MFVSYPVNIGWVAPGTDLVKLPGHSAHTLVTLPMLSGLKTYSLY